MYCSTYCTVLELSFSPCAILNIIIYLKLEREEEDIDFMRRIVCVLSTIGYPSTRIHTYRHPCPTCTKRKIFLG